MAALHAGERGAKRLPRFDFDPRIYLKFKGKLT